MSAPATPSPDQGSHGADPRRRIDAFWATLTARDRDFMIGRLARRCIRPGTG